MSAHGAETMCAPCSAGDHGRCRDERGMGSGVAGVRCACGLCWRGAAAPRDVGDLAPLFAYVNEHWQGRFCAGEPLAVVLLREMERHDDALRGCRLAWEAAREQEIRAAVLAEREACARLAEEETGHIRVSKARGRSKAGQFATALRIASGIRART